ncbi:glycosyltransferase [Panacibacter ginsenosidivorans]|uniref:glycosyltransferase n=1 Tax=Panacibacter ginsenosidivorans TaxID=1813871 RepID=UPI00131593CA|nr:glycosyltransferase [Panacibacter ginsenosidivorans]
MENREGVSVIICCYNSALRLPETLRHIYNQKVPEQIGWEIIVVDNNSTDNTSDVAMSEWRRYNNNIPFKVVHQEIQGLSFARSKGFENANYDILIFCDDDNWLRDDYIRYAFEIMQSNESIGILGGVSSGYFEVGKPFWFDAFMESYAVGKQMYETGIANSRTYLAGAAVVVRKAIYQKLNFLSYSLLLTGRIGKRLTSGEDTELCWLAMFLGFNLYYDERLRFVHFMPKQRLNWKYCVSMIAYGHSIPRIYFSLYHYLHNNIFNNREVSFDITYKTLMRRHLNYLRKHNPNLKSILNAVRSLFISTEGSEKEIQFKSDIHKLRYLLFNKSDLEKNFYAITSLMQKIKQQNVS